MDLRELGQLIMVNLRKISDYVDMIDNNKIDIDAEWGDWLERTYDPDTDNNPYDRLEDKEI